VDSTDPTSRVVVVIPTYQEAETIAETIAELVELPCDLDVIIVDDNSPNGTAEVVRNTGAFRRNRVRILPGASKGGIGPAYRRGFLEALRSGYDIVVQMDADGSHPPASVTQLLDALSAADLVIGSRYIPGGSARGLVGGRRILSQGGNVYARTLLRLGVHDLTGGFKGWRSATLTAADARTATSDGYSFQIEMTLRAARAGARIRELPIQFGARRAGVSKMNWRIASEALVLVPRMALRESGLARDADSSSRLSGSYR
jgi:dolichol-phosphate mannosyltransferase